ncbi:hypothetical protein AQUCO_00300431v1 [Aquilegia coerulea]|uniref:Uncharacterized protein n=1 Tax=Aquilegia coerulea TaxID=218851 RepID=A0A2G5EYV0_AQUCA|nr:hypothetical protein AQUCO_00300431v1 [Aquilegia coerulea]
MWNIMGWWTAYMIHPHEKFSIPLHLVFIQKVHDKNIYRMAIRYKMHVLSTSSSYMVALFLCCGMWRFDVLKV